eukprot:scaffold637_cov118-Isochrysis_galbana.AAC.22
MYILFTYFKSTVYRFNSLSLQHLQVQCSTNATVGGRAMRASGHDGTCVGQRLDDERVGPRWTILPLALGGGRVAGFSHQLSGIAEIISGT